MTPSRHPLDKTPGAGVPEIFVDQAYDNPPDRAQRPNSNVADVSLPTSIQLPEYNPSISLEDQLWKHAVQHATRAINSSFWPPGILKALVTEKAIANELAGAGVDRDSAWSLARQVYQGSSGPSIQVFTIFLFLQKLVEFVNHILPCRVGLRDGHLPLFLGTDPTRLIHKDKTEAQCCFNRWRPFVLEAFDGFQRRLATPIFRLKESDNTLIHLDLDDKDILPWCEEKNVEPVNAMSGGFGSVTRVRIHPLCHDFHHTLESINVAGGVFAIKKLKQQHRVDFQREVTALERFNGKVHPHLITLLATFTQAGYYYMIFPWAECDLDKYWEDHPDPNPGNPGLVRWISQQCLGIMEAVSVIHNPSHLLSESRFGRHGDIKAENILWFKPGPKDKDDRGILVISDLGLTAINSDKSRSMQPNTDLKVTPSYRPPECDIKGGVVSRAFDIWTLGCLYLELVCWLLQGNIGKLEFDRRRTTPFIYGANADIYFDIKRPKKGPFDKYIFQVKGAVSETIHMLHEHPRCSLWAHSLLNMIEEDMLVVLSEKHIRKTSHELLSNLKSMHQKAQSGDFYCTNPVRQIRSPGRAKPTRILAELNEVAQNKAWENQPRTDESEDRSWQSSLPPDKLGRMDV